jgi:hypothetical protein
MSNMELPFGFAYCFQKRVVVQKICAKLSGSEHGYLEAGAA